MLRVIVVRPGSTEFEEQGRIKGSLNIPLSAQGCAQAERTAGELNAKHIGMIYSSPGAAARQTAERLAKACDLKVRIVDQLLNIDLGLWNGKRIDELKETQPRLYRQWQEHPETVCPPNGETLEGAKRRVIKSLQKIIRKNRSGTVAIVVPEPMATIVMSILSSTDLGDLWKAECTCGQWESIDVDSRSMMTH